MSLLDFLFAALFVFLLMSIVSIFAIRLKRNDLADVTWGPGFFLSGVALAIYKKITDDSFEMNFRKYVVLALVGMWAIRLFFHVGLRTLHNPKEDERYAKMRQGWGDSWRLKTYTRVFLLQGILMLVIALPIYIIVAAPAVSRDLWCLIGPAIWLFGFFVETIADNELTKFKKDPANKGKIIDHGLWSWSRHPNYFGEVTQWWGIFLLTLPLPQFWLAFISPVAITFLILKVSGVPLLEKQMEKRPGFREYKERTSEFVLWPPKKT